MVSTHDHAFRLSPAKYSSVKSYKQAITHIFAADQGIVVTEGPGNIYQR